MSSGDYDIDDALVALRDAIASHLSNPRPQAVWVWPKQHEQVILSDDNLPAVVVSQVVNTPGEYGRKASGLARHIWAAEILIFLSKGTLTNQAEAARVQALQVDWLRGMAAALFQNLSLNGRAQMIGDGRTPGTLFEYRIGHIHWDRAVFWGIRMVLPVMQLHKQDMIA